MEPSDEMVESFAREYYGNALVARDAQIKSAIENALRAALAVMPDQYRLGWIAGRDAAADHVCGYCIRQNSVCADHISNMEPPE